MQKIQSWFDQLSLGKATKPSRRRPREKRRATAEPPPQRKTAGVRSQSTMRKEEPKAVSVPMTQHNTAQIFTSSLPRRNKIRTNPWVSEAKSLHESQMGSSFSRSNTLETRRHPPPTLCVFSPDTSICSSGYVSNDSSPETSMVWSGSEEFKPWKLNDETNIYQQLHTSGFSSPSCHSPADRQLTTSPVYAEPWNSYTFLDVPRKARVIPTHTASRSSSDGHRGPMVVRNVSYRPPSPMYAQPFEQPDEPQETTEMTDEELARDEFLWKLDQQIHELEMRSEELRQLMEQSKNERRKWLIPKMERSFELAL